MLERLLRQEQRDPEPDAFARPSMRNQRLSPPHQDGHRERASCVFKSRFLLLSVELAPVELPLSRSLAPKSQNEANEYWSAFDGSSEAGAESSS